MSIGDPHRLRGAGIAMVIAAVMVVPKMMAVANNSSR